MNLMERFSDPELLHTLSIPEKLAGSGVTAAMGMGVTFSVLVFLWICISLMARLMARNHHSGSTALSQGPDLTAAAAPAAVASAATAVAPSATVVPDAQATVFAPALPTSQAVSTTPAAFAPAFPTSQAGPMASILPTSQAGPTTPASPIAPIASVYPSASASPSNICHMAVIAGAVAAHENSDTNLLIRKIKRGKTRSAWSAPITERKVSK